MEVGATKIEVLEVSPHDMGRGVLGLYEGYPRPRILLAEGLDGDIRALTLLHEVLHAIDDIFGLELGEQKIRILEQSLGGLVGGTLFSGHE